MSDDYHKLLDKLYSSLPERKTSGERFEVPRASLFLQGNKTIVRNYAEICATLRREPAELAKYLFKELAAPGVVESNGARLVLQGRFTERVVNEKIEFYYKANVECRECGKPDTHVKSVDGVKMLVCEACGARRPTR